MNTQLSAVPKIQVVDNKPMALSLDVAEFFGKRHDNVLQKIQNLEQKEPGFYSLILRRCKMWFPPTTTVRYLGIITT